MAKNKNMFDLMKEIRRNWVINPRTRVKENELKNNKKRRQKDKKVVNEREE